MIKESRGLRLILFVFITLPAIILSGPTLALLVIQARGVDTIPIILSHPFTIPGILALLLYGGWKTFRGFLNDIEQFYKDISPNEGGL